MNLNKNILYRKFNFLFKYNLIITVLTFQFIIFFVFNQFVNPHPDMIDHWIWGQFSSISYYEHPPMVALIFKFISKTLGDSELALEISAQLVNIIILILVYIIARNFFGEKSALITLLLLLSMPYFTLGSIFLNVTQPFLFFWLISLFCWTNWIKKKKKSGFIV